MADQSCDLTLLVESLEFPHLRNVISSPSYPSGSHVKASCLHEESVEMGRKFSLLCFCLEKNQSPPRTREDVLGRAVHRWRQDRTV